MAAVCCIGMLLFSKLHVRRKKSEEYGMAKLFVPCEKNKNRIKQLLDLDYLNEDVLRRKMCKMYDTAIIISHGVKTN